MTTKTSFFSKGLYINLTRLLWSLFFFHISLRNCWKCRSSFTCIDNEIFFTLWSMYVCTYSHTLRKKLRSKYPIQCFCRRQNQGPWLSAQPRPCSPFVEPLTHEGELQVFTLNTSIFSPLMPEWPASSFSFQFTHESNIKVVRIEKMIINWRTNWLLNKFSLPAS